MLAFGDSKERNLGGYLKTHFLLLEVLTMTYFHEEICKKQKGLDLLRAQLFLYRYKICVLTVVEISLSFFLPGKTKS